MTYQRCDICCQTKPITVFLPPCLTCVSCLNREAQDELFDGWEPDDRERRELAVQIIKRINAETYHRLALSEHNIRIFMWDGDRRTQNTRGQVEYERS